MFDTHIMRERALELNYEDCRIIGINERIATEKCGPL
jgi:hypothetical protein